VASKYNKYIRDERVDGMVKLLNAWLWECIRDNEELTTEDGLEIIKRAQGRFVAIIAKEEGRKANDK